jgi:hypothetical protein
VIDPTDVRIEVPTLASDAAVTVRFGGTHETRGSLISKRLEE